MILLDGPWFKDEHGRTLLLRGVNLGGSSKVPFHPDGATHVREGFFDHRNVSFVGRTFPLEEADEHFARLRAWGFTFLRFLVTWEAIEHAGPGLYDEQYLDYVYQVVKKAAEHGISLFIDPHQDVWSRFSGGDGAPGWTFEVIGMDVTRFADTGAAIVHATHGDPFPQMVWGTNYSKLAAATMFTLFFAGNDLAPRTLVRGEPVQEFLQRHYIASIGQLAARLKGLENVVGYDTMNEPSAGLIGCRDLRAPLGLAYKGDAPTPFQAMLLGSGFPQEVAHWELRRSGPRLAGMPLLNPDGVSLWREGCECIWRTNGVWGIDASGQARLLRPDHFAQVHGRPVDFCRDYWRPFANRFAREIRAVDPQAIIFLEGVPMEEGTTWGSEDAPHVVHAAHWYDILTLATKSFVPWLTYDARGRRFVLGRRRVQQRFNAQVAEIKNCSEREMGGIPTLIGEFGVPFDMQDRRAYRTGDFSRPAQALDMSFQAMEANLVSCTLWNYTADNSNERGDQWNGEDLSIFSRDQQTGSGGIHDGGRALQAAVRPYARAVAGEPLRMRFEYRSGVFEFEFRHDPQVTAPTEFFVPNLPYPQGYAVEVSDGTFEVDRQGQTLIYRHSAAEVVHRVRLRDVRSARERRRGARQHARGG